MGPPGPGIQNPKPRIPGQKYRFDSKKKKKKIRFPKSGQRSRICYTDRWTIAAPLNLKMKELFVQGFSAC